MDSTILTLNPGKIFLTVELSGVKNETFNIAVVDTPASKDNRTFYQRTARGSRIIINLPKHPDRVRLMVSKGTIKRVLQGKLIPVKIPYLDLATHERPYNIEDVIFRKNYNIISPARMFVNKPIIEWNPDKMNKFDEPTKTFIFSHELGHLFFDDEEKADRFATISFLNRGYNLSSAIYALTRTLGHSDENIKRALSQHTLLKNLSKRFYG